MAKQEQAEKDYMNGMKYKDIAEKYGTTINTVKSWRKRYAWSREGAPKKKKGCTQNKKNATVGKAQIDDGIKETMQNEKLPEKERLFCLYYIKSFNATQSYLKAYDCSYDVANAEGYKLLVKPCIKEEINRLKELKRQQIQCDESDIVELQMRIAFSNIGDALSFSSDNIRLRDSDSVDTQLIKELKKGKSGISVKMKDHQKALDWLTMYFEINPDSKHKREFDKHRLELEYLKLEATAKADEKNTEEPEDNFLEALNASAKDVWKNE